MATRLCVIGENVLADLDALLAEMGLLKRRCAVYDQHTYEAKNLRRVRAEQEIVLAPEGLHANETSTAEVLRQLNADTEVLTSAVMWLLSTKFLLFLCRRRPAAMAFAPQWRP